MKLRILLIIGSVILFTGLVFVKQANAEQSKFKQQILPIDCVFEVIDIGTQQLRFLTPETCPVDPVIEEPKTEQTYGQSNNVRQFAYYSGAPIELTPDLDNKPQEKENRQAGEKIDDLILQVTDDFFVAITLAFGLLVATIYIFKSLRKLFQ